MIGRYMCLRPFCAKLLMALIMLINAESIAFENHSATTTSDLSVMPLAFTENIGQWPDSILYRANAGGATMWFTTNGTYYQFTRKAKSNAGSVADLNSMADQMRLSGHERKPDSVETMMIRATPVGCNTNPQIVGDNSLGYKCNFFIGNDQSKWRTNVPNYTAIIYKGVYPGIDLKYYGDGQRMEYDFLLSPGADYSKIKIAYDGTKSLAVNASGDLIVETGWGTVVEKAPAVYQWNGTNRVAVASTFRIVSDQNFGFTLGPEYDPELPAVIDPVLTYSTYLGGNGYESASGIYVDGSGSAYVTGTTFSSNFPTLNPYQTVQSSIDAFVTKLTPAGNALVYSTYLGGTTSDDNASAIAVDQSGSAYVAGQTSSSDFPTRNPYQSYQASIDAFVTKLSPSGDSLVYSSYLGGKVLTPIPGPIDAATGIAVDSVGSAYVVGYTFSKDFPVQNQYQTFQGVEGSRDAFVTKFAPAGNTVVFSTYLGGNSVDKAAAVAVDNSGSVYVTGSTSSSNFPTLNPYQTYQGPLNYTDAFVTKFSAAGNSLMYSTYLGGSASYDDAYGIAVDATGQAYVAGTTSSSNFPLQNPFQLFQGPASNSDAFVTKLSASGNSLAYSTCLGGNSSSDQATGIAIDTLGSAYVVGTTSSTNFPLVGAYQTYQGSSDAFLSKISPAGNALAYSTYLGGSTGSDGANGIAVDVSWAAYVVGVTYSTDFPTVNPFQAYSAGLGQVNAFAAKFISLPEACCFTNGSCANLDPAVCLFQGGQPGGVGSTCATTSCPQPPQACCFSDGSCQNIEPSLCQQLGGNPGGVGSACITTYCPKPPEACCFPNGACLDIEPMSCQQQGGLPQGVGSTCATTYCVRPPESCCFANGSCTNLEPHDCQVQGGTPQGTGTNCTTTYCPRPPQACCLPDGSCQNMEPKACQQTGGHNQGPGSVCASASCPQPQACCLPNATCQNLLPSTCLQQGGHPQGPNAVCNNTPCCCVGATGNVDCDPGDGSDISDLSALIDNLYVSFTPLCCPAEANVDGQTGIDISDLSALIDYLYISFAPPAACQ